MFFYQSECKNCCLYIIIQKIALQAESETCFQIWFFPRFGGKNGGVLNMRMQVILDSLFAHPGSPIRVQPLYGVGRKESSGTGLIPTSESRKFEKSTCHFLTNRKRPFFLLANKRARRIMNLVASD